MLVSTDKKWDYALGMIKVDGLEPSPEFKKLIEKESRGEMTTEDMRKVFQENIRWKNKDNIVKDATFVLDKMNQCTWEKASIDEVAEIFSKYLAELWKVHPYREGNTRTVITFCSQFIESKGFYIDSDLFKDHAQYMRTALVAATALFSDLGDKRKPEYLEKIVLDALERGQEMKQRVSDVIKETGLRVTESRIRKIVYWNRLERHEHGEQDVRLYLLQNRECE